MKTLSLGIWWVRIATFLLAALAAASATYWVLKWTAAATPALNAAPIVKHATPNDPQLVARLLGGGESTVTAAVVDRSASHFKLTGVVTSGAKGGYALIATDGQAAKSYKVGSAVNDTLVLQSVATRSAALGSSLNAPTDFTLELPALARSEGKTASKAQAAANVKDDGKLARPPEIRPRGRGRRSHSESE